MAELGMSRRIGAAPSPHLGSGHSRTISTDQVEIEVAGLEVAGDIAELPAGAGLAVGDELRTTTTG